MRSEIAFSPAFASATVHLDPGESVQAEAGAMLAMTSAVSIKTDTVGGFMKGLKRSVLGGESFFMNTFTADGPDANVVFAPALPGDIVEWHAHRPDRVPASRARTWRRARPSSVDSKWGGAKTFFSSQGLFLLKVSGTGPVLVSSYGAIQAMDLEAGQRYTVDTGHMVGWSEGVATR